MVQINPQQICLGLSILLFLLIFFQSRRRKESFEENIYSKNKLGQKIIHGSSVYFNNPYPPALEQGFLSITKL